MPQNFGQLYFQLESPRDGYPIFLKHTERGGFDAYMTWSGPDDYITYTLGTAVHVTMRLVDGQLTVFLDGQQIAGPTNITFADRYFWIGYRLPANGAIEAEITNLSIE